MNAREAVVSGSAFLFVPGDRPDRFAKARQAGPDVVVLDLEDAVAPPAKDEARAHVVRWLEAGGEAVVRVNAVGTPWHQRDLEALTGVATCVMLPKAEDAAAVAAVGAATGLSLVALLETPRAFFDVLEILRMPGVVRAAIGTIDLAAELGVDPDDGAALGWARSTLVAAAAAAGLPRPLDGVTTNLADGAKLAGDVRSARQSGFGGKLCIHPGQVGAVQAGFSPTAEELEWARSVLAAAGQGVAAIGGHMVDPPVIRRAERLLAGARHAPGAELPEGKEGNGSC